MNGEKAMNFPESTIEEADNGWEVSTVYLSEVVEYMQSKGFLKATDDKYEYQEQMGLAQNFCEAIREISYGLS